MPRDSAALARRLAVGALAVLAAVVAVCGLVQARDDFPTVDEPVYVSAGLLALTAHDVDYNAEHPPLSKAIAAIPVLFTPWVMPPGHVPGANDEKAFAGPFLRAQGDDLGTVTFASRIVPVAEILLAALLVVMLGRQLVSLGGGLVAGALWLLSPMVLGLGHLDGVDLPFAIAVLVWSGAMLHARHHDDRRSVVLLGVAVGLCLATSALGLVVLAITAGLLALQRRVRGVAQWAVAALVGWAVLWASYLVFDLSVIARSHLLLPQPYWDGLLYLREHDSVPSTGYLLGQTWLGGQWWFWPGSLLVKLTTPVLLVLVLAPLCWRLVERPRRRDALAVLAAPALVLLAAVMVSPRDLGVRYLLPVVALWCVGAAPVALLVRRRWGQVVGAVAGVAAAVMLVSSLPHSLAYTSPPFVPAYRVATDSNVDWGQDLTLLQQWAPGKHPYVDWFGARGTSFADVPGATDLAATPVQDVRGWVAVSATKLTSGDRDGLAWLRKYCPVSTIGGSVLIYRFDSAPTADPGPVAPALPCTGDVSLVAP